MSLRNPVRCLAILGATLAAGPAPAANPTYYFDLNGPMPGSGVSNEATYVWTTNDLVWSDQPDGGSGLLTQWNDIAADTAWQASFSASASGSSYTLTLPPGETRRFQYLIANRDHLWVSGHGTGISAGGLNPRGQANFQGGVQAMHPGRLTFDNIRFVETNASVIRIRGGNSAGLVTFDRVGVGYKAWAVQENATFDLGSSLQDNLIFTPNYLHGGRFAHLGFFSPGNNVVQGSGLISVELRNWYHGPHPSLSWNKDLGGEGGFAGRGGKLLVNFFGDARILQWGAFPNAPDNFFVPDGRALVLGSYYADSEVELRNGIDLNGAMRTVRVLSPLFAGAAGAGSFATLSGVISDTLGGGGLVKASQAGQAAGTLVLSGANTYRGPTEIREGKLVITSAHQGGGAFSVFDQATLGVHWTSTNSIPMASLSLGTNATGVAALEFDIQTVSQAPVLRVTNFVVTGSPATISVKGTPPLGRTPLIQYAGTIGGQGFGGLVLGRLPDGVVATLEDNSAAQSVDLNVTALPVTGAISLTGIQLEGTTASIDFEASDDLSPGIFSLESAEAVDGLFLEDGGASIAGTFPHLTAVASSNGPARFYRVRHRPFPDGPPVLNLVGDWEVDVTLPDLLAPAQQISASLRVALPATVTVNHEAQSSLPQWMAGEPGWARPRLPSLQDPVYLGRFALVPGSVQVADAATPGMIFSEGVDFNVDYEWGAVGRLASGSIGATQAVLVCYQFMKRRLDSVVLTPGGELVLREGEPHLATPLPPALSPGEKRVANVWVPAHLERLTTDHLFPILETVFPEPPPSSPTEAERLLPATMARLHSGELLKILAWGDSVTAGYAGVVPWQNQFVDRLRARFPNANIQLTSLGWGAHNSSDFLAAPPGHPCNYQERILQPGPHLVISEFLNDAVLNLAVVESNYTRFLHDFQGIGAEWIILTPNYSIFDMSPASERDLDDDPRPYTALVRRFSSDYEVALGDASVRWGRLWRQGLPFTTLLVNTANHPNTRGLALYADSLLSLFPER